MTQRVFLLSLFVMALLSCWLVWHFVFVEAAMSPGSPYTPDSFVDDLTVTVMDANGQLQYQLFSPHLEHSLQPYDTVTFTKPFLTMYQYQQPPWLIHADQGVAYNSGEIVKVWGNVNLTQVAGKTNEPTTITTTSLTIYTKQRCAVTNSYVKAVQPNSELDSVGMKLNTLKQTLDLFSKVHGVYVPQPK